MDASDADIRAWARETGRPVSDKGKVGQPLRSQYSAAHNGEPAPGPDYPGGMTDDDFETAEAEIPDDMAETRPAAVRPPKAGSRSAATPLRQRFRRGPSSGKPKPKGKAKHPRVSTAELWGSVWRIGAKVAQPLPPLYRVTRLQSVIAGPLIEDAVKGTIIDTIVQPLARLSNAGKTVTALVAPDLAIGAMAYHLNQTEGQPNPVVMQACQEMLRHGLMAMMDLGGEAFAAQLARERDQEERYGGDIDMIMAYILSDAADPATEEENIARMAARFAGQTEPETVDV